MAQSPDEIAKDIVVAWLSHHQLAHSTRDTAKDIGKMMGEMYTAVLQAVEEGVKNRPPVPVGAQIIIEKQPD
jgi:hypothetical protein